MVTNTVIKAYHVVSKEIIALATMATNRKLGMISQHEYCPAVAVMNGIDLSDYFLDKSSYNPVVYIHKRYLPKESNANNTEKTINVLEKQDKSHRTYIINKDSCKSNINERDPLIEQTIKFAKDIIPLTIPVNTDLSENPVYYTIKSSKKTKRKHEPCAHKSNYIKNAKNKEKLKHEMESQHNIKRNKVSVEDSLSRSSQNNTIDDTNENRSFCCSSETSDQKHLKELHENENKNKRRHIRKIVPSETFEAFASEYISTNDSNIKIHLMNEEEKHMLCESISGPIVKSIKEILLEHNNQSETRRDIICAHKSIENQSNKLDNILEKLTHIENKIDKFTEDYCNRPECHKTTIKTSKLEEIGKDIMNMKDILSSEEELAQVDFLTKRRVKTASVTSMNVKDKYETEDDFSKGENIPEHYKASTSKIEIIPERPNRIPARFCWTDTVRKN
ncbi:unnamed protein product [Euphydryas editha]|uniref:Uncharacterized protein n=1 Tax=Euphydryas editha TaxID=104508 RepID=A0AAU9TTJ6_EUPED|nr:unnamed protein product [Euphydryas editha]